MTVLLDEAWPKGFLEGVEAESMIDVADSHGSWSGTDYISRWSGGVVQWTNKPCRNGVLCSFGLASLALSIIL